MGEATAMPSGMLWAAMAKAKGIPTSRPRRHARYTAMPSGKLWMLMPSAVTIPSDRKYFCTDVRT